MSNTSTPSRVKRPSSYTRTLQDNLDKLVGEARNHQEKLESSLVACAAPILSLPESLNHLVDTNRLNDIPKVQALTKSVREDLEEFNPKVQQLKEDLEKAVTIPANSSKQLSNKYSKVFAISTDMLLLSGDVMLTATKSSNQLEEILKIEQPTAPEA